MDNIFKVEGFSNANVLCMQRLLEESPPPEIIACLEELKLKARVHSQTHLDSLQQLVHQSMQKERDLGPLFLEQKLKSLVDDIRCYKDDIIEYLIHTSVDDMMEEVEEEYGSQMAKVIQKVAVSRKRSWSPTRIRREKEESLAEDYKRIYAADERRRLVEEEETKGRAIASAEKRQKKSNENFKNLKFSDDWTTEQEKKEKERLIKLFKVGQ